MRSSFAVEIVQDVRSTLTRSTLLALSLFVALLSVVAVLILGATARDVLVAQSEQQNAIPVTMGAELNIGVVSQGRLAELLLAIQHTLGNQDTTYAVVANGSGTITAHGYPLESVPSCQGGVNVLLEVGSLRSARLLPLLAGSWNSAPSLVYPSRAIINLAAEAAVGTVGSTYQWALSGHQPVPTVVSGVIADGNSACDLYEPMTTALLMNPSTLDGNSLQLLLHSNHLGQAALSADITSVAGELGLSSGSFSAVRVDNLSSISRALWIIQLSLGSAAGITMLVAMMGALNIGMATVKERSKELRIRRAVGATRRRIFGLVVWSAVVVSLIATSVSIGVAWIAVKIALPHFVSRTTGIPSPGFPWDQAALAVVVSVAAALVSNVIPSLKAARLDIASALRE